MPVAQPAASQGDQSDRSDDALRSEPRILYLSEDPQQIRAQLAGERISRAQAGKLRDEISTDEITPLPCMVHFDATLGRHPYTGLKTGGQLPIGRDAVRDAGITVVVAGLRYGKGSSREHSPVAEKAAGVQLVFAESFERIYRQNADNIGLLTSTDFDLLARLERGEPITLAQVLAGRDPLAAAIVAHGGLLRYGQVRLAGIRDARDRDADTDAARPASSDRPMTLFEKIIARHALVTADTAAPTQPGDGGFVRADWRFIHEYYTGLCAHLLDESFGERLALHEPHGIVSFEDHLTIVHRSPVHLSNGLVGDVRKLSQAHRSFVKKHRLNDHGSLHPAIDVGDPRNEGSEGISHALMTEQYVLPGQLAAGTDSHTTHLGAVGCVAYGVGTTDMANAFVTGAVRITMPAVLRIELQGQLPEGVAAKDVVLHLLAQPRIRAGEGVGKVFEFAGPVISAMSTDERATLTNMCAELGGFTGMVEPDAETVRFLKQRRGIDFMLEPWMRSDPGAHYSGVITLDCTQLSPMLARPGDPGNGLALASLPAPVRIDIAYGGSCTAGKRADFDQYHAVLDWAAQRGLRVADGVQLYLQFGTQAVREYCEQRGYLQTFEAVGAQLLQPSCGACSNCGPGVSVDPAQVTVSAINRNFPGRSGPGSVWLASPATVAASAIAGQLASFAGLRQSCGAIADQDRSNA